MRTIIFFRPPSKKSSYEANPEISSGYGYSSRRNKRRGRGRTEELNIKYADVLSTADHHTLAKHGVKEIAHQQGYAATFLPKWNKNRVGSASHVHQSLFRNGSNVFYDAKAPMGKSKIMDHYLAGLIKYASEITIFLAPYVNSYKRFAKGTFAPTHTVWSIDNRTAAFRVVGDRSKPFE